ncbi:MAG: hypothetical protein IJ706_08845 [Clostridia bacterium]|nr:hypothetical protein [Clostridia bacterium]
MSFFMNNSSANCPGKINGNPMNGLCEKVCIEAEKVFDACIRQTQIDNVILTVTGQTPETYTDPLTFVSARSVGEATVTVNAVDSLPDRENFARVQATITVPMEVIYTDANGVQGKGQSSFTYNVDIIMYVPDPSIIPYRINAVVSVVAPDGTYEGNLTFNVSCCVTAIMKVVMTVELMIPSYGYATIPQCQEYSQDVCSGFFDLPVFPQN